MLLIAFYLLVTEIHFVHKAVSFDASIIEVRKEFVAKGKGSVLAYVPVVEIPLATDGNLKIRVDTFSEQPTYYVGDKIQILCEPSSLRCKKNTFVDKWGDFAVDFILSLVFLSIPLLHYWRFARSNTVRDATQDTVRLN